MAGTIEPTHNVLLPMLTLDLARKQAGDEPFDLKLKENALKATLDAVDAGQIKFYRDSTVGAPRMENTFLVRSRLLDNGDDAAVGADGEDDDRDL